MTWGWPGWEGEERPQDRDLHMKALREDVLSLFQELGEDPVWLKHYELWRPGHRWQAGVSARRALTTE